jgi:hypothetical protein
LIERASRGKGKTNETGYFDFLAQLKTAYRSINCSPHEHLTRYKPFLEVLNQLQKTG